MNPEPLYALDPTPFRSMQEAQELTDQLELNLTDLNLGAANIRPEAVEILSELVNNAAEHGQGDEPTHLHVRFMPHRRGHAFDIVVADSGPGIRATLARNPNIQPESDVHALHLAVQELVSGTGNPVRGIGLWMTLTEMRKPGRKFYLHSGSALLTSYGDSDPQYRPIEHRHGTIARLTIPA